MADNIATAAATIAADDVGGALYQRVKVVWGADGAVNDTAAAAPLPAEIIGANCISVTVTPTQQAAAYSASDLLFDATAIANAVRANGGYCMLDSIHLIDQDDQGAIIDLILLNAATSLGTLNSAPSVNDAGALTTLARIAIAAADWYDLGAAKVCTKSNLGLLLKAGAATTSLYIAGVLGASTPTVTAAGLVIQLNFRRF